VTTRGGNLSPFSLSLSSMELSPGKCLIPWRIFCVLPIVRQIAPNPAAVVELRRQLQGAGAINQRRMIDIEAAEAVVVSMRRQTASQSRGQLPERAKPATKPAPARKPASRRRLSSGYTSPDLRHEHANWA